MVEIVVEIGAERGHPAIFKNHPLIDMKTDLLGVKIDGTPDFAEKLERGLALVRQSRMGRTMLGIVAGLICSPRKPRLPPFPTR